MIVVAGESLVDLIVYADHRVSTALGGGPFNTARRLGRLGAGVAFLGRLSTDGFGARLREALAEAGVTLDLVVPTNDPTTLAVASLDRRGTATYRFSTRGTAAPGLHPEDIAMGLPAETTALHVGTLGLVLEPIGTTIERIVEDVGQDVLVTLDPNCRPEATPDPEAYRHRIDRLLGRADVVKVSVEDLAFLIPGAQPLDGARSMLGRGASAVLVTDGGRPVQVLTPSDEVALPVPEVEVVDTVGAGDAFSAGFLAAWAGLRLGRSETASRDHLIQATEAAIRVAAESTTVAGG
jgi:fructokinase